MKTQPGSHEAKGFYKLSWIQRIGFGSGDLAQNLIYQTISMYLLLFYTNVFGLNPTSAAFMFLLVRIVDVLWDPVVGTFVDKHNPRLGKYRSYLVLAGIPLCGFAILCFWNGFSGSLAYAYITYVGMSMLYTLINVPYGALNASLTRDTNEITVLTSVRMFMANAGGLAVAYGIPMIVAALSPDGKMNSKDSGDAWFTTMVIYAMVGLALLVFCFSQTKERVVMDKSEAANVKVSDLWVEFSRNRPLRILAFFFITAFAMMSVGNAAGSYYMIYNVHADASQVANFMALGSIPAFIFMPMVPAIKRKVGTRCKDGKVRRRRIRRSIREEIIQLRVGRLRTEGAKGELTAGETDATALGDGADGIDVQHVGDVDGGPGHTANDFIRNRLRLMADINLTLRTGHTDGLPTGRLVKVITTAGLARIGGTV